MTAGILADSASGSLAITSTGDAPRVGTDSEIRRFPGRIDTLDACRFIAVLGVIFIHSIESTTLNPYGYIGTVGVPFYLFASLFFQARSFNRKPQRTLHSYIWARVKRLYLPFLAWTVIYLIARNIKHLFISQQEIVVPDYQCLWIGSAHHLWFLPFLMVVTIVTAIMNRMCRRVRSARWSVIAMVALVGAFLSVCQRPDWLNYVSDLEGVFLLQCWKALPSALLGWALAWTLAMADDDAIISPALGLAGVLLTLTMVATQIRFGYSRLERTLSGLGWLLAALATWSGPWIGWLARLGRNGYGIYLAHVLFVEGVQAVAHRAGFGISAGLDLFTFGSGVIGGLLLTWWIDSRKSLAWING